MGYWLTVAPPLLRRPPSRRACNSSKPCCWAHVRRKFVEALDEDKKHASEAIVYISKLYKIEEEMREAGLDYDAVKERRQKESYPIIQAFEKWMDSVASAFTPKSRMGKVTLERYSRATGRKSRRLAVNSMRLSESGSNLP